MASTHTDKPLSPRKRPGQGRSIATVEAILEAAARVLETRGFVGYNTNDIASVAGVSVGSLYQYFPNKAAISSALIEREMCSLLESVREIAQIDASSRLNRLIQIAVDHQLRRPVLARLLDVEEEHLPASLNLEGIRGELGSAIHTYVEAQRRGNGAPGPLAEDVVAIIKGMVDAAGRRGETDAGDLNRRVARAVFGYMANQTEVSHKSDSLLSPDLSHASFSAAAAPRMRQSPEAKRRLLDLADELGNVAEACRKTGFSRDSYYRIRARAREGGSSGFVETRQPGGTPSNRASAAVEAVVVGMARKNPDWGQARVAHAVKADGVVISPFGVRCIWMRHGLETRAKRRIGL